MRVAIAQVDGKWPNLALAKIAAFELARGAEVERFNALQTYDRVWASKVFADTPDDPYLPRHTTRGGSGYPHGTVLAELPMHVEYTQPDWSLWPTWPHDVGFTTRGCVRRCPFCIVPDKEGPLSVAAEFGDLTTGRPTMILHDNNVTAAPLEHFRQFCADATAAGVRVDFRQGLDARLLTAEHCEIIARSRFARRIHLAVDAMKDEGWVRHAIALMVGSGIIRSRLTFYTLVGYDTTPEQDLYRVELLRSLGCDPFVMPFKRDDPYQRRFARWVNNKVAFKSMTWNEWQATFKTKLEVTA